MPHNETDKQSLLNILQRINKASGGPDLSHLVELVEQIRPGNNDVRHSTEMLAVLLEIFKETPELRHSFVQYLQELLSKYDALKVLTASGILPNRHFFWELKRKIEYKLLPPLTPDDDLSRFLNPVFYKKDDFEWIGNIPESLLLRLMDELDLQKAFGEPSGHPSVLHSIETLSNQIFTISLEPEIADTIEGSPARATPFRNQAKAIRDCTELMRNKEISRVDLNERIMQILLLLKACELHLQEIREKKKFRGTSLHQTFVSQRLQQLIARLKLLLRLLINLGEQQFNRNVLELSRALIKAENQKYNIGTYIRTNIEILAFQIVAHTASGGERYIAENPKQYRRFLLASMYGGVLIALFACFKLFIDGWDLALAGSAIFFSLNYAACFVLVSHTGGIIATKQPALTASTLARCMEAPNQRQSMQGLSPANMEQLKAIVIKVSSSQFISLLGNFLLALSLGFLFSMAYGAITGSAMISQEKADTLIADLQPLTSLSIWYAALTGVFLSLSGFISGFFDNRMIYEKIPERLKRQPLLQRLFSEQRLDTMVEAIRKNFGKFMGNFSLGVFLGTAGIIGYITGLPIDIRHIAFSAGNFGIALESLGSSMGWAVAAVSLTGVVLIGLTNFLVSFSITLFIAMKSRKITFFQTRQLMVLLLQHFLKRPQDFFLPVKPDGPS